MSTEVRLRQDTAANVGVYTLASGELGYKTDTKEVVVGDGSTVGGNAIAKKSQVDSLSTTVSTHTTQIATANTNISTNTNNILSNTNELSVTTPNASYAAALAAQQDSEVAAFIQNYKQQKSFVNLLPSDPISFTRASSATYFDANGVMQTAASGERRYTHDPATLEPLGLLIEEQRTNLATYSDDLLNTGWTTNRASIVNNGDGWFKLTCDTTSANSHFLTKSGVTKSPSTSYVKSIEAKQGGGAFGRYLYMQTNTFVDWVTDGSAIFDLQDGVVVSSTLPIGSYGIQSVGGGAYKCWIMSTTEPTITASEWQFEMSDGVDNSFDGDGSSYIYLRRPQIEAGSFPTSYIPTTNAAVTRVADKLIDTVNTATYFQGNRGTIFADFYVPHLNSSNSGLNGRQTIWSIGQLVINNFLSLTYKDAKLQLLTHNGSTTVYSALTGLISTTQRNKVAISYNVVGGAFTPTISINGTIVTGVSVSGFDVSSPVFRIGHVSSGGYLSGTISRLTYYKRALSQTELNGLTA